MEIQLSIRLKYFASFVEKDMIIGDIGSDHGYLPYYLLKNNTGSDGNILICQTYLKKLPEELKDLLTKIITKNLILGISGETINKAFAKNIIYRENFVLRFGCRNGIIYISFKGNTINIV